MGHPPWGQFRPTCNLLEDKEFLIALELSAGSYHGQRASGCAAGNSSRQVCIGYHAETCGCSVEGNGSRPGQALPQNIDSHPHLSRARQGLDEGAKTDTYAEDGADIGGATQKWRAVQIPVGSLNQPCIRLSAVRAVRLLAKAVERSQGAAWCHFEDRTATDVVEQRARDSARGRRSVEVPIGSLNHPCGGRFAVSAVSLGAKAVERSQRSAWGDSEDCPDAVCPAGARCAVQISVGGLNKPCQRPGAVSATGLGAKAVKTRECAAWGDFEYRAIVIASALSRRPVKASVSGLNQPRERDAAVGALSLGAETVENLQNAA
jgi:hypothetical protein